MKKSFVNLALFILPLVATNANAETIFCKPTGADSPVFLIQTLPSISIGIVLSGNAQNVWNEAYVSVPVLRPTPQTLNLRAVDNSPIVWLASSDCAMITKPTIQLSLEGPIDGLYTGTAEILTNIAVNPSVPNCKLPQVKPDGPAFKIGCQLLPDSGNP